MERLAGKTIMVTGGGRGLGASIVGRLIDHGATVIAVSRTQSELESLTPNLGTRGGSLVTVPVDLGKQADVQNLIALVHRDFGGLDALINNAAVLRMLPFETLTEKEFDETIEVNFLSATRLIRGFLPEMKSRGRGSIINVTSGAATRGFVNETDYCATKFGLEGFSYSLALELESANISVNLVGPGFPIKPTSVTADEYQQWPSEKKSLYRDPSEMVEAFAFLTTQYPMEGGVTGQRFNAFELTTRINEQGWEIQV